MEKKLKVSFSASNEETISAGTFEITIYEPLEDKAITRQISDMVMDEISIEGLNKLSITIEN